MTNIYKLESLLDRFIESDPDRAERWLESTLAKIELRKRLAHRKAITPLPNTAQDEPVAVHQFRVQGCSDWYDGHPDYSDGTEAYETRTLYTRPQQPTQGCNYCNHPQYAGIKCKNCGRVTEQPAQDEPTRSQKLRDAGITRRPRGWDKDGDDEQPEYPEGHVVGPCICGSWPGGKCLKCPRIEQSAQNNVKQSSTQSKETLDHPVAWQWLDTGNFRKNLPSTAERSAWRPLYTRPQAREPQPCPYVVSTREGTHHCSLSQREWVDLTDDEMLMIYGQEHEGKKYNLGRMVQAKLKEKNT